MSDWTDGGETSRDQMPSSRIAVVTDSTADIPADLAERLGIHVVANTVVIDGKSLLDGKDITRQAFYEYLPKMRVFPTTATASSGVYQELYEQLLDEGFHYVLSIHTSSLLSGIINAATVAAQEFGQSVRVIDSGSITMGLGFQVLGVAEALSRAGYSLTLEVALRIVEDLRKRVRVIAMLDTLEYIRRSGRVSWAKARLGNLLHLKPFLEVRDGQVLSLGEARTFRKGFDRLVHLMHDLGPLERVAVLHTNAEAEAHQIMNEYTGDLTVDPLFVNITTVIGAHVGPKGLGIAAVIK